MSASGLSFRVLRYFRDPLVPLWKRLLGFGAVAYVVLPFDVLPDFIPLIGWLDDFGVVSAVSMYMVREIRKHTDQGPPPSIR